MEHVNSFQSYSKFHIWSVNTEFGFPPGLERCRFDTIVLHYSLFSPSGYLLNHRFRRLLEDCRSYKIAIFQDEYHYCQQRFAFINQYAIDNVFTLVEPEYFHKVYGKYTSVPRLVYTIPGYVPQHLVATAKRFTKPDHARKLDIGYRGRKLPAYMGKGAQEKYDIAVEFREHAVNAGLEIDIEADENRRIYGQNWYRFMANCRAVLGVEAGVSIFDLDDLVRSEFERITAGNPRADFATEAADLLREWEGNVPYRTISPRHFEAAAFRTCQILFEGSYSGVMEPMVHYIPLKKDFSNIDEVVDRFNDSSVRHTITENAYRDLVASGKYEYNQFIGIFDRELTSAGKSPEITSQLVAKTDQLLAEGNFGRQARTRLLVARHYPFPGRRLLRPLKPLVKRIELMIDNQQ